MNKRPHLKYSSHTSVTLPAIGALTSVALSSRRMNTNYIDKVVLQVFFYKISLLGGWESGNFNCR